MFSVDGLVSGLDTAAIIDGALSIQQRRIDRLNVEKQEIAQEQTAFKSIESQLLSLQGSMGKILRSSNNAFDQFSATSSDEEQLLATASSNATAGSYQFRTVQLAQAHQVKSNGFTSRNEELNTGTVDIRVGDRGTKTIRVDENNNTVQGLVDSINAAGTDVSAAIIDDGSDSDAPLRILLTSSHTGSENEIQITNKLGNRRDRGDGVDDATQPDFTGPAVQQALDAQVRIGSGEGAITVSSETNEFTDVIPGVVLDVVSVDPDKNVLVSVAADTTETVEAVQGFIDSYNSVIEFIGSNSEYDAEAESAGLLLGNRTAASVQSTLQSVVSGLVHGVNDNVNNLTAIGISTGGDGTLTLDQSKMDKVLSGQVEGAGIEDIRRLFAIDGQSDNPGVEFVLGTNNTQVSPRDADTGELIPYEVEINRAASQASLIAETLLAENTTIDSSNELLKIDLDGVEVSLEIPVGTYTQTDLAKQLKSLINKAPDIGGREVTVEVSDGLLSIESASYGRGSKLEIISGSAMSTLGLTEGQAAVGTDVAGVFRVKVEGAGEDDIIIEQATGNGRLLSSNPDNEYTADMQVRSTLLARQIDNPVDAHLTVTRGIGAALDAAIDSLLEAEGGTLTATQDGLSRRLETIDENIGRLEDRMESKREALTREFSALESTLAELQSVGDSLSSGLNSLVV